MFQNGSKMDLKRLVKYPQPQFNYFATTFLKVPEELFTPRSFSRYVPIHHLDYGTEYNLPRIIYMVLLSPYY